MRCGIERRCRFICNYHGRPASNRLGNQNALALSAAELMWIRTRDALCLPRKKSLKNFACSPN